MVFNIWYAHRKSIIRKNEKIDTVHGVLWVGLRELWGGFDGKEYEIAIISVIED